MFEFHLPRGFTTCLNTAKLLETVMITEAAACCEGVAACRQIKQNSMRMERFAPISRIPVLVPLGRGLKQSDAQQEKAVAGAGKVY